MLKPIGGGVERVEPRRLLGAPPHDRVCAPGQTESPSDAIPFLGCGWPAAVLGWTGDLV